MVNFTHRETRKRFTLSTFVLCLSFSLLFSFSPHPSYFHPVPPLAFSVPSPSNYRKPLLSTHRNARSVCAYNGNCLRTLEYHLRDGEFNWLKSLLPLDNSWPRQRYENQSRCLENKCFLYFPLLYHTFVVRWSRIFFLLLTINTKCNRDNDQEWIIII